MVVGPKRCNNCPAGRYNDDPTGGLCVKCAAGKFSKAGSGACVLCSAAPEYGRGKGGYISEAGSTTCTACEPGKYDVDGKGERCEVCPIGRYSSDAKALCRPCKHGQVTDLNKPGVKGATGCFDCRENTYNNKLCDDGSGTPETTCNGDNDAERIQQNTCYPCPSGQRSSAGDIKCSYCNPGAVFEGNPLEPEKGKCTACAPGKKAKDGEECVDCEAGKYSDKVVDENGDYTPSTINTGNFVCSSCEPGKSTATSQIQTVTTVADSGESLSGYFAVVYNDPTSNEQANFDVNFDGDSNSFEAGLSKKLGDPNSKVLVKVLHCENPANTCSWEVHFDGFSDQVDLLTLSHDNLGGGSVTVVNTRTVDNGKGKKSCSDCETGKHRLAGGSGFCLACDAGKYSVGAAVTCASCIPGKYSPSGMSDCSLCSPGTYTSSPTSISCQDCPPGKKDAENRVDCIDCGFGKYSAEPKATECDDCEEGKYQDELGSAQCEMCEAGKYTDRVGLPACEKCNMKGQSTSGQVSGMGQSECTSCVPGTAAGLSPEPSVCGTCPGGMYQDEPKQQWCKGCPAGKYTPPPETLKPYNKTDWEPDASSGWSAVPDIVGAVECRPCKPGRWSRAYRGTDPSLSNLDVEDPPSEPSFDRDGIFDVTEGGYSKIECELCPIGTYSKMWGTKPTNDSPRSGCLKCPAGTKSISNRTLCENCANPLKGVGIYSEYSREGDSACYKLATAVEFFDCPASKGYYNKYYGTGQFGDTANRVELKKKRSVCEWFFIDGWEKNLGVGLGLDGVDPAEGFIEDGVLHNEGVESPFGDSCESYTICESDPASSSMRDNYKVMCNGCAEGFYSAGQVPQSKLSGNCAGQQFESFCYNNETLNTCPTNTICEYWSGGKKEDDVALAYGNGNMEDKVSPFYELMALNTTHDFATYRRSCAKYSVCGYNLETAASSFKLLPPASNGEDHRMNIACTMCAEGFTSIPSHEKTFDVTARPRDAKYAANCPGIIPTSCYRIDPTFLGGVCPTERAKNTDYINDGIFDDMDFRRRSSAEVAEGSGPADKRVLSASEEPGLRGSAARGLDLSCGCSCTNCKGTNFCKKCDLEEDRCQSMKLSIADGGDCDPKHCYCKSTPDADVPKPRVRCEFLHSEYEIEKVEDSSVDHVVKWDTKWDTKFSGQLSPFRKSDNTPDECIGYKVCFFQVNEVDFGQIGEAHVQDVYNLMCEDCNTNEGFYPARDPGGFGDLMPSKTADKKDWMCDKKTQAATACYLMKPEIYEKHFKRATHDCNARSFNPMQLNNCYYWHDSDVEQPEGEFKLSTSTPLYGPRCKEYRVCKFDPDDFVFDKYYLQCTKCAEGYDPVYGNLYKTDGSEREAAGFGCGGAKNQIITECERTRLPPTPAPTPAPTASAAPTPYHHTESPTPAINTTKDGKSGSNMDIPSADPEMFMYIVVGSMLCGALAAMAYLSRGGTSKAAATEEEARESVGFDMSNPIASKAARKKERGRKEKATGKTKKTKKKKKKKKEEGEGEFFGDDVL